MPLPRLSSLLFALVGLSACGGNAGPADTKAAAKADAKKPDAKKLDAKVIAGAEGKPDTKADTKADDEGANAAEAFAASREDKVVEVTAKPGTPEWFVQGLEAFRAGNIDPIVANFAPDIVWDAVGSPLEPPSKGKQAVQSRWEDLLTGIPDMKLHATRILHQGDLVVLQVVLTGSHKGDFRGIAPTGKPLGAEVMAWVWHDDKGKAKLVKVIYNEAALLAQMGQLGPDAPVPPIPAVPEGAPEIVTGEDDAAAKKLVDALFAGKDIWKNCSTSVCAPTLVHHEASSGRTLDTPEDNEALYKTFYTAFPDLKAKPGDTVAFGPEWVASFVVASGTHKGELGGIAATNKKVKLPYGIVAHVEDGKIAESWGYANELDMLAQLGAFTAPKTAKSSAAYEGPPKLDDDADEGEGAPAGDEPDAADDTGK